MLVHSSDPLIRQKCYDASVEGAKSLIPVFHRLWQFLPHAVGIAAPQIGEGMNVFWFDAKRKTKSKSKRKNYGNPQLVINPILHHDDGTGEVVKMYEGCLSCPGRSILIPRCNHITVSWTNEQGKQVTRLLRDFEARVWLHEFDHLQGKIITDYEFVDVEEDDTVRT